MRVALYNRVSTRDKGQDPENQALQLRAFAKAQGWTIVHEYTDHASAKNSGRAQFKAMFAAASKREFDAVVTWALDRLSREGVAQTFEHIKLLKSFGVQYVSFMEPHFRTTGSCGELMMALAAWIGEQERVRLSERTIAGLERARRNGKVLGRPQVICDRSKVREMRDAGMSLGKIAAELSMPKTTIARILA